MPFKKRTKKTFKRRKPKREPSYVSLAPKTVGMSNSPVDPHKFVRMKFNDVTQGLDPAVGVNAIRVYRCNDLYDPDSTGLGAQPMGFDQWMIFYEHFTVLSSKITCTFLPNFTQSTANQYICGIYTDSNSTSTAIPTAMMEQPGTRYGILTANAARPLILSKTFSTSTFFGKSRNDVLAESELKGTDVGSPSEQAFWHVFATAADTNLVDAAEVRVNISIEYFAYLSERRTMPQS